MNLTCIPADETDVGAIYALSEGLICRYEDLSTIDLPKVLTWVRRKIEENISEYRRILRDGIHVGYYRLAPDNDGWELDDLYIFPEFQNRGIGTAVIRQCCAQGPVTLYVFTKNTGALALYCRLGFREIRQLGTTRLILRKD